MHIHGQIPDVGGASFYGVANQERAEAARRAAKVRKHLFKAASTAETADPDADLLIGRWLNSQSGQVPPGDEYTPSGRDPGFK